MIKTTSLTIQLLLALILFVFNACESTPADNEKQEEQTEATTEDSSKNVTSVQTFAPALPSCQPTGIILEGNRFWADKAKLLIVIKADSTTLNANLGESHRILEVYDADCQLVQRETLPVDRSPDFPYYIASITYNNSNQLLAIHGFDVIRFYDIENRKLLPAVKASFLSNRYSVDAQTGMIEHLELWEQYLVGHARDQGGFVFNLKDKNQPKAVMPIAEYEFEENFYSLFALQSGDGGQQLIIPYYDKSDQQFEIHAMLPKPMPLNMDDAMISDNKRFVIIDAIADNLPPVAIDLKARKKIDIPADMVNKDRNEILKWMKGQ